MRVRMLSAFHTHTESRTRLCVQASPLLLSLGLIHGMDMTHEIVKVYDNGTVHVKKGAVVETVNIRKIKPYRDEACAP